jgi:hypothetical protein
MVKLIVNCKKISNQHSTLKNFSHSHTCGLASSEAVTKKLQSVLLMEQRALKNVNNCLNINICSYL